MTTLKTGALARVTAALTAITLASAPAFAQEGDADELDLDPIVEVADESDWESEGDPMDDLDEVVEEDMEEDAEAERAEAKKAEEAKAKKAKADAERKKKARAAKATKKKKKPSKKKRASKDAKKG
jgi:hypothetical protein